MVASRQEEILSSSDAAGGHGLKSSSKTEEDEHESDANLQAEEKHGRAARQQILMNPWEQEGLHENTPRAPRNR